MTERENEHGSDRLSDQLDRLRDAARHLHRDLGSYKLGPDGARVFAAWHMLGDELRAQGEDV
jgi:hypothetical protein